MAKLLDGATIHRIAGAMHDAGPDAKRPLFRELPAAPTYPIEALGALRPAAEALHRLVLAPIAMCAQSALAAVTLAVQAHRDVELPCGRRPLVGLFATVAESGERKTSLDRWATRAIRRVEARWAENAEAVAVSFAADREAYDAKVRHLKGDGKADRPTIRKRIEELGPAPKPPPSPMIMVADPTPEGLILHLAESRPYAGIFTSEGGVLLGGIAFKDETRLRTGCLLNALWDGEAIRRRRVGTGAHYLPGRRCSAHLMLQPAIAGRLFGDGELTGIGLVARFLTVAPATAAGTRFWNEPEPAALAALDAYDARLAGWLDREPRMDACSGLDPEPLDLMPEASRMWTAFHDCVERDMTPGGELAGLRAFASKMPEHAGRLAAVLACYGGDADAVAVRPEHMAGGIALAQHYARELMRLGEAAAVAPDLRLAQRLLVWWQTRPGPRCHLAAIYQGGPYAVRDASTARRMVAILEEHGWVRRLPPGTVLDAAPRRDAWELIQ